MNCKINIEDHINLRKSKSLFLQISKDVSDLSASTLLVSSKIKSWVELSLEEGSVFSTSYIYDFNNVETKLAANLETWKNQQVTKITALAEEEQPLALENLEITISYIHEAIDQGIDLFKTTVREDSISSLTNPIINNQTFIDFSSIGKLLNNSDALVNNLAAQLDKLVTSIAFINLTTNKPGQYGLVPEMEVFVKNDIGLNNNIVGFKARLWADILKTLDLSLKENGLYIRETPTSSNWVINKELFTQRADGSTRYSEILAKLDTKYKALKKTSLVNNDLSTVNSYIKMLLLINLDTFINDKYSDYIGVNPDSAGTWGTPSNGFLKYTLKKSATLNATWSTNSPGEKDIENFESKLFKLISSTISYKTLPKFGQPSVKLGSYLDTVAINATAAIINSTPITILFNGKNIQEWYEEIANNRATFKEMLSVIIAEHHKNDNLAVVIDAIYSIQEYLYNDVSGVDNYYQTMANPNDRTNIINIESILFNQLRNVETVPYYIGEWNESGISRILNPLLLDTKVGEDFHDLYSSLSIKWVTNAQAVASHAFWTSRKFDDFIKFLEEFGGFEFSERAINEYKKSTVGHTEVFKPSTIKNLRDYFGKSLKVLRNTSEYGVLNAEESKKATSLTEDEWVEMVKTNSKFGTGQEKTPIAEGLDLMNLFKAKHNSENFNIVSSIKNSKGDSFSVLAVSNLALAFNSQIHKALKNSRSAEYSHILESSKGFVVLLEAITKKGSKDYSELSTEDNMALGLFDLFYNNVLNKKQIIVQPYNLSDKSKILAQVFDYEILTRNKSDENKFFTSQDAKDYLINIQKNYFGKIVTNLVSDYQKIFPKVKTIQDIDNVLAGKNWQKDILPLVDNYNRSPKNKNNQLRFVEELHYSNYKDGPAFNKLLKSQIEIWTSPNSKKLEEFIDFQENQFIDNISNIDLDITNVRPSINGGVVTKPYKVLEILKKSFGFTNEDFDFTYETKNEKIDGETVSKVVLTKEGLPLIKSASFKLVGTDNKLSEPLKRYLWTRNLTTIATTNAAVKGTFLHPVKSKASFKANDEITVADIAKEENERTVVFYKRMVLLGGSINRFKQGGADGLPTEITVAYSNNPMSQAFNYAGEKQNVKVADGGVWISPFMTQQFMDALPGTNLSRVMKPLGISIEDNSLGFLKCAFFGLNNEMVLTSMDSEYSVNELMQKMHSVPLTHNILNSLYKDANGVTKDNKYSLFPEIESRLQNLYVKHNGQYTRITKIEYTGVPNTYNVEYEDGEPNPNVSINNLYDLWNLFGGPHSASKVGEEIRTGEESINLVNYIIKLHALNDILEFKSAMVGMIVPREAIKSGITNTNPVERLTVANNIPLSLASFKTEFLGIQLDAAYDADEYTVSEVTQVLSALAENNTSPEQFTAVYNIIGQVIQKSLYDFNVKEEKLEDISKIFMKNIQHSTTVNNARAVLDNIESELDIPFSDKTVFKQFIATVISNINKEFIRNKVAGAGMVLNPSHGMIKIFEDSRGKTYLAQDLVKRFNSTFDYMIKNISVLTEGNPEEFARVSQLLTDVYAFLKDPNVTEFNKSRAQLQFVIDHLMYEDKDKNGDVIKRTYAFGNRIFNSATEVSPLDSIQVFDLDNNLVEELNLTKIDDYYNFLTKYDGADFRFEKSFKRSRDLAPSFKNFSYTDAEGIVQYKNGYSLGITRTKFLFEELVSEKKPENELMNNVLSIPLVNGLHEFLLKENKNYARVQNSNIETSQKLKLLKVYVNKFVQRTWDVISNKAIFEEYDNSPDYFDRILKLETGVDTLEFGIDAENPLVNTIPLLTYNAADAENVVSKLYKSQFKLDGIAYSDVTIDFFNNLIKKFDKKNVYKYYDVLLSNIHNQDEALQVMFNDLKTTAKYEETLVIKPWAPGIFLINENGDLVRTQETPGMYEIIGRRLYVAPSKQGKTYKLNHLGERMYSVDEFQILDDNGDKQTNVFQLNDGRTLAVASTKKMKTFGKYIEANSKVFGLTSIKDSTAITDDLYDSILQSSTDYVFKQYIKERRPLALKLKAANEKELGGKEVRKIVEQINKGKVAYYREISSQMFNSWKLSNYILSARIPAQAGQSYMSMKTVGYMHENENSIYVSHWQIWLQGSDFDIDKAYVMKYDVKNGIFVGWSPYFDLRTKESTKLSLQLPPPSGRDYLDGNIVSDNIVAEQTLDLDQEFPMSDDFKTVTLEDRVNVLTYVAKNWDPKIHRYLKTANPELFKTVRNHNSYYSDIGFNNFKIQQILQVSRNAKNQISANTPVSFGDYRTVGSGVKASNNLSLYNPYGMYKQQENNYVGKDVIGMAATGIKGYFSMIAYFSKYYEKKEFNITDPEFFINEYTVNDKTRTVTKLAGLNLKKKALDTLHTILTTALADKVYTREDGTVFTNEEISNAIYSIDDVTDPALKLSALLSAATDNAKELLLADINAGIDFAGMHIFLIMMGFDEIDIAKFMTSELSLSIKGYLKDSFLKPKFKYGPDNALEKLTAENLTVGNKSIIQAVKTRLLDENADIISSIFKTSDLSEVYNLNRTSTNKVNLISAINTAKNPVNLIQTGSIHITNWFNNKVNELNEKGNEKNEVALSKLQAQIKTLEADETVKDKPKKLAKLQQKETELLAKIETGQDQEGLAKLESKRDKLIESLEILAESVKFNLEYTPEETERLNANTNLEQEINNFRKIYFHAKELVNLGSLLSINQGVKATLEDTYATSRKIVNIINRQQSNVIKNIPAEYKKEFNKFLTNYRLLDVWHSLDGSKQSTLKEWVADSFQLPNFDLEEAKKLISKHLTEILKISYITPSKFYLPGDYIDAVLENVDKYNLITKGVDHNQLLLNSNYKQAVIDYLNLIKFNFNTVDILDKSPHFQAMTEAFQTGELFLGQNVLGYKFINKLVPILADIATYNEEITSFETLSKLRLSGGKLAPISMDSDTLDRTQDTLFELILMDWMKGRDFKLDFTKYILSTYKDKVVQVLSDDRTQVILEDVDRENPGDSLIVDLSTEYGRAKFKYLMDFYIINGMKDSFKKNGFLSQYTYKKGRGFNMRKTIKFYQSGVNYETLLGLERGLENIVKNTDNKYIINAKVLNGSDIVSPIPMMDLLSIYDKMVNFGRFGGNRSTLFINKSAGVPNSTAKSFLDYQIQLEKDKSYIDKLINSIQGLPTDSAEAKEGKKNFRESLYLSLLGTTKLGVRSYLKFEADRESSEEDSMLSKNIGNEYFRLVESVDTTARVTPAIIETKNEVKEIGDKIENYGVLQINCK